MGHAKVIEQLEILNVWHENFPQNKKQSIFQSVGVCWRISMNWRNFKQKTSIACFAAGLIHIKGCILREVSYYGKKQTSEQNTRARAQDSEEEERITKTMREKEPWVLSQYFGTCSQIIVLQIFGALIASSTVRVDFG